MTADDTVLVTGATGNTGRELVELLHGRDVRIRVMVRSEAAQGRFRGTAVEAAVADFDDPDAVAAALAGVSRAYLVTPSSERAQAQQERFAELAARAGVTHLVKLSQLAADEDSPVRFLRYHSAVERRIRELGIGFTFLRPNLYFQGMFALAGLIREQGKIFAPIGDARVSAVDVRDIAAVAAAALTEPGHEGATYTITGPAAITHAEIAEAIGAAVGREVSFADIPPDAFAASLRGAGMPDWQVDGLIEDYAHYSRGEAAAVTPAVAEVTGHAPRTVAEFARDHAEVFR
ncbi:SDR family oxidoreductase [Pseudonocardia acaciae]|uniref:SDR family oxidoreductase n=1 Tax=Pseudonocardia acaciae TaxID=551276 RepID=UPI00049103CD|nr:SDR family oxidoreductase [Pseudonocardia acaciae]